MYTNFLVVVFQTGITAMYSHVTRDGEVFKDPNEFKPDRWCKDVSEKIHPFSSLPFGFGPRSCYVKCATNVKRLEVDFK